VNILLWVLQAGIGLHTAAGALWKFSNSPEQTMPSLGAIPNSVWLSMSAIEMLCVVGLLLPAVVKRWGGAIPIAAAVIAAEMLLFCVLHLFSGASGYGPIAYWLVVAALCAFIVYGRSVRYPVR
jgi:hypothetical protein